MPFKSAIFKPMNMALFSFNTLVVFFGWLAYGLFHSLFAMPWVKRQFEPLINRLNINYRLIYVLIAIISPLPLIYFQMTHRSPEVWVNFREIRLLGGIAAGMGLALLRKAFQTYDTRLFFGLNAKNSERETFKNDGLLKHVRHPLYLATLLIFWGWFLFSNSYNNLAFCLANTLYVFIGIQLEERKLIDEFGQQYLDYIEKTPMLIPNIKSFKTS